MKLIIFVIAAALSLLRALLMPTTLEPSVYLLYPDCDNYRFDSAAYAQVVHLAATGANKVEEVQTGYSEYKKQDVTYSHNLFLIAMHGDSVFLDKYKMSKDTVLERRDIFTKNCKLLYSYSPRHSESGEHRMVYDSASNSYRKYRPDPEGSYWNNTDTLILEEVKKYDRLNRLIRDTNYGAFHKISWIVNYEYDEKGGGTELFYELSNEPPWPDHKDPAAVANYDSSYRNLKEEFAQGSKTVYRTDSLGKTREIFQYDHRKGDTGLTYHGIMYYDSKHRKIKTTGYRKDDALSFNNETKWIEDENGRLISKQEYMADTLNNREEWRYDKKGRCIMHMVGEYGFTWKYDSRDNIIEADEFGRGKPMSKFRYTIYYK